VARDTHAGPPRRLPRGLGLRPLPVTAPIRAPALGPGEAGPGSVSRAWSGDARGRPSAHCALLGTTVPGGIDTPAVLGAKTHRNSRDNPSNTEGASPLRPSDPRHVSTGAPKLSGRSPAQAETSGMRSDPFRNRNGRGAWGSHGRPPREPAEGVACAAVLLSLRHRLAVPPLERAEGGLNCYPQAGWPSHLVRSRPRCESDRVADRPFALHSEALRRSGWNTRLAPSVWAECSPGSSVLEGREPHDDLP